MNCCLSGRKNFFRLHWKILLKCKIRMFIETSPNFFGVCSNMLRVENFLILFQLKVNKMWKREKNWQVFHFIRFNYAYQHATCCYVKFSEFFRIFCSKYCWKYEQTVKIHKKILFMTRNDRFFTRKKLGMNNYENISRA